MNPKINKILEKTIQTTYSKDSPLSFCVVGAGNGGLAMAGYLGLLGFPTTLYNRSREKLHAVQWHKGIELSGVMEGFGKITLATTSMEEAIKDADIIMVTVPATGHYEVAKSMAQYLRTGQIVTLNPGRTGGALAFNHALSKNGCCTHPLIAETSTFIFASRSIGGGKAKIFRIKNSVRFATLPAHFIPQTLPLLNKAFPQFIPEVKALSLSGIFPSNENVLSHLYPLAHPIFFLTRKDPPLSLHTQKFLSFVLSPEGQGIIAKKGLIPILPVEKGRK
jgi:hypothetical protein